MIDLFICSGEMSGDLHGAKLIEALLKLRPNLKIGAVAGPHMRKWPIREYFPMELLKVMGFLDVFKALPRLIRSFYQIRNQILKLNPKVALFIDYPGFHLRLENSLRKKGFQGKLIHFICPSVWAWGKKRIPLMAKNLDLLLTLFPFEETCFSNTHLKVKYVGHPLAKQIASPTPCKEKILALFPGSRKAQIDRNLPLQLKVARQLKEHHPELEIAISQTGFPLDIAGVKIVKMEDRYELMRSCHMAIATSGTVTLELALHGVPTVVSYAIHPLDQFLAQKIFRIDLPFYSLPNIVAGEEVFKELLGSNLTEESLFFHAQKLLLDPSLRHKAILGCQKVQKNLGTQDAALEAAQAILLAF